MFFSVFIVILCDQRQGIFDYDPNKTVEVAYGLVLASPDCVYRSQNTYVAELDNCIRLHTYSILSNGGTLEA